MYYLKREKCNSNMVLFDLTVNKYWYIFLQYKGLQHNRNLEHEHAKEILWEVVNFFNKPD
jgi:hypothetical protein